MVSAVMSATWGSPGLAQDASSCICILDSGTVGSVTNVSGWVRLNGTSGLVEAVPDAQVGPGSVLTTGVAGTAQVSMGSNCQVAVGPTSQMSVIPTPEGKVCVRLVERTEATPNLALVGGAAAGLALATVLFVGAGEDDPVSK